jgi:hypothetical protein
VDGRWLKRGAAAICWSDGIRVQREAPRTCRPLPLRLGVERRREVRGVLAGGAEGGAEFSGRARARSGPRGRGRVLKRLRLWDGCAEGGSAQGTCSFGVYGFRSACVGSQTRRVRGIAPLGYPDRLDRGG